MFLLKVVLMNIMNKVIIAFFIIGLFFVVTACSTSKTDTVNPTPANNNVNSAPADNNVNTVPADNNVNNAATPGNVKAISDIKHTDLLGKTVTVRGRVVNNVKIGRISGYRLNDSSDSIPISSQNLAKINTTVTVTGTLLNSSYFGYYIQVTG